MPGGHDYQNTPAISQFFSAVSDGDVDVVKDKLTHQIPIEQTNEDKQTALHIAAQKGNISLLKLLIGRGANINAQDEHEFTPLHFTVQFKHFGCTRFLLNKNAKMLPQMNGWQPLYYATMANSISTVQLLLGYGADINATSIEGKTAMDMAQMLMNKAVESILKQYPQLRTKLVATITTQMLMRKIQGNSFANLPMELLHQIWDLICYGEQEYLDINDRAGLYTIFPLLHSSAHAQQTNVIEHRAFKAPTA